MESHCVYKSDDCKICKKDSPMNQPTWREELKTEYLQDECEQKEDSEGYAVYENDGELVSNWWLDKLEQKLSQQRKETVETIESMKRPCNCMTTTKKHAIVCSTQDTRQHKMETKFLDNIITKLSEEK